MNSFMRYFKLARNSVRTFLFTLPTNTDEYSSKETTTPKTWLNGQTIYRKVIEFAQGPNVTQQSIPHGIVSPDGFPIFVKCEAMMVGTSGQEYLPFKWTTEDLTAFNGLSLKVDEVNVYITPTYDQGQDWRTFHGFVILEYVKFPG